MKFKEFDSIRDALAASGVVNESTKSFSDYTEDFKEAAHARAIREEVDAIIAKPVKGAMSEEEYDRLATRGALIEDAKLTEDEKSSAVVNFFKNLRGLVRIKGIAKAYQDSMVDEAIADMDYARRKRAAGKAGASGDAESLKMANSTKKAELKARTSALGEKIDNFASTNFLKSLAAKAKIEAKIAKSKVVLRIASKEEAKELKLKMVDLNQRLADRDEELRTYQSEEMGPEVQKEAKNALEGEIKEINGKIKEVQTAIESAEDKLSDNNSLAITEDGDPPPPPPQPAPQPAITDEAKAAIYNEIAKLKIAKADLVDARIEKQKQYNQVAEESEKYKIDETEGDKLREEAKKYETRAASGPAASGPAASGPAASGPAASGPAASGPAASGPAASGPAASGPAASGPAKKEPDDTDVQIKKLEQEKKDLQKKAEDSPEGKKHDELGKKREELLDQLKSIDKEKEKEKYDELSKKHDEVYDEMKNAGNAWREGPGKEFRKKEEEINAKIAELKKKKDETQNSSVDTNILKKYMTFEEFHNKKQKKQHEAS